MPTIEPNSIESESVRAQALHPWPAETCFHYVVIVMKTVVRTVQVIGTTTAKNPSSMPFLEAGVTFSSGLEALNRYYVGWLLRWLKRKPPTRRGVFSLEPPMFRLWQAIFNFRNHLFAGVQQNFDDQLNTPSGKLIFHSLAAGLGFLTRPSH